MLFSGRAFPELAEEIGAVLGVAPTPTDAYDFANGEIFVRYQESVRGSRRVRRPVHGAADQQVDHGAADHGRRAQARLGQADHRRRCRSTRTPGRTRSTAAASRSPPGWSPTCSRPPAPTGILTVDLHTAQIQGFFDGPVDHLFAMDLLADYVESKYAGRADDRRRAGLRPGAGRRALDRPARRLPAGVHPQDPRPAQAQPGRGQPGRRRGRGPGLPHRRRHDRHRRHDRARPPRSCSTSGAADVDRRRDPRGAVRPGDRAAARTAGSARSS